MARSGNGSADGDAADQQQQLTLFDYEERRISTGPIPSAETLAEYDKVLPGLAERIIRMAESSTTDRSARENRDLEAGITRDGRGQTAAFIGGGVCLVAAIVFFVLAGLDEDARGVFLTGGVVLALIPLVLFIRVLIADVTRHGGSGGGDDLPNLPTLPGA